MGMLDGQTVTIILSIITTAMCGVWQLSRVEKSLRDDIAKAKKEVEMQYDVDVRVYGETMSAIRQKIMDVELFAAQNYVRREGFQKVQDQITSDIRILGDKIEAKIDRMEERINAKNGH